ncbi:MAG: hypothetical protein JHC33_00510 [Ignisphaera sp.]|nr:hypothetical protein [Ignisphaera sp.]
MNSSAKALTLVIAAISALVLASLAIDSTACIDPSSVYAFEIVLNKPGVVYNLTPLKLMVGDKVVRVGNDTYMLRYVFTALCYGLPCKASQYEIDLAVTIYLARFVGEAPYVEGLTIGEQVQYLGIRVEPLAPPPQECFSSTPQVRTVTITTWITAPSTATQITATQIQITSTYTTSTCGREFSTPASPTTTQRIDQQVCDAYRNLFNSMNLVVRDVLRKLMDMGVIKGLTQNDIESIAGIARPGLAGWNNRLVYSSKVGGWMPYSELVAKGIIQGALLRGNSCSYSVELGYVDFVRSLKPLGNTTIAVIVYPGPTQPLEALSAQEAIAQQSSSTSGPMPLACVAIAPCGSSTSAAPLLTSTPIASAVSYGGEWRDGTIVAVAIATGLVVAIAMYIILSRRMLS